MSEQNNADDIEEIIENAKKLGELSDQDAAAIREIVRAEDRLNLGPELTSEPAIDETDEAPQARHQIALAETSEEGRDIRLAISEMNIPQKIKLALFGNSICRGLLIFDSNRMIQQFVLKNAKITEPEVLAFIRNPQIGDGVIRAVADSKMWMKSYDIRLSVVTNPRTPGDLALKWLRYLNSADLKKISKSRNLPQLIAVTAKKRLAEEDKK